LRRIRKAVSRTASDAYPEAFKTFERAGWSDSGVANEYDRWFVELTTSTAGPLLDAVGTQRGTRLLDVATGPGNVAAAAAESGAQTMGIDFSPAMVELARRTHPGIAFLEGDAEGLTFPDASFDAVVMNYGLLHLWQPERAIAEAFRVLRPGGRFAFSVWATPDQARGFGLILEAVQANGDPTVPVPAGPPFFRFSDTEECQRVLLAHGFVDPQVTRLDQTWRLPSADALLSVFEEGTVRTRAVLKGQTEEALEAIRAGVREACSAYTTPDGLEIPMPAVLASAQKP
jgi:SAM-dependent methyltransferase